MAFSAPPPPPPPTDGASQNRGTDWQTQMMAQAIQAALKEIWPSKREIVDAIRRGVKEAILEADD